ncbi:MAG: transposase [Deltaproteobacteria bacterium]|nr:transposase [Deltaproteobacteria bacterium]
MRWTRDGRAQARQLFAGPAAGNAVVVQQMLEERGLEVSVRTVQRTVADQRREQRVAQVATVRFETEPGSQMQIDFGEKWVSIAGELVRVFFLVAVLSYSRRLFVKAFLNQRSDDWREGIAAASDTSAAFPARSSGTTPRRWCSAVTAPRAS